MTNTSVQAAQELTAATTKAVQIAHAQKMLNTHPDASPFWDSRDGQDVLAVAQENNLLAMNTNRERCQIHSEQMRLARASINATPDAVVDLIAALEAIVAYPQAHNMQPDAGTLEMIEIAVAALAKVQA